MTLQLWLEAKQGASSDRVSNLISLCYLCALCVSGVWGRRRSFTTETQRTQRLHREDLNLKHNPSFGGRKDYCESTPGLRGVFETGGVATGVIRCGGVT